MMKKHFFIPPLLVKSLFATMAALFFLVSHSASVCSDFECGGGGYTNQPGPNPLSAYGGAGVDIADTEFWNAENTVGVGAAVSILSSFADSKEEHYVAAAGNGYMAYRYGKRCRWPDGIHWCVMSVLSVKQTHDHYESGRDFGKKEDAVSGDSYYSKAQSSLLQEDGEKGCDLFATSCKNPKGSLPKFKAVVKTAGLTGFGSVVSDLKKKGIGIDFDSKVLITPSGKKIPFKDINKRIASLKGDGTAVSTNNALLDEALTAQSVAEVEGVAKDESGKLKKFTSKLRGLIQEDKKKNLAKAIAAYEQNYLKNKKPTAGAGKKVKTSQKAALGSVAPSRLVGSSSAGLVRTLAGGVIVGVKDDSIFKMIRRKYQEKRKKKIFREKFGVYQY